VTLPFAQGRKGISISLNNTGVLKKKKVLILGRAVSHRLEGKRSRRGRGDRYSMAVGHGKK